jgi:hypothetical protein
MVLPPRFCAEKEALQAVVVSLQGRLRANNRRGGGGGKARNTGAQERNHSITITHRKEDDYIFYTENRWE